MAKRRKVSSLLGLAVLALLASGLPMHPYQMASVLRRTGQEGDLRIKWGSLYTVVGNLEKHGFIEATGSDREGRRPERTRYTITAAGRAELEDWLRELVAVPEPEYRGFEAALSALGVLAPDEATALLRDRLRALDDDVAARRAALGEGGQVPRAFLIESEYALTMREAEATWVRGLLKELAEGTLPGVAEWRAFHETGRVAAGFTQLLAEGGAPTS